MLLITLEALSSGYLWLLGNCFLNINHSCNECTIQRVGSHLPLHPLVCLENGISLQEKRHPADRWVDCAKQTRKSAFTELKKSWSYVKAWKHLAASPSNYFVYLCSTYLSTRSAGKEGQENWRAGLNKSITSLGNIMYRLLWRCTHN